MPKLNVMQSHMDSKQGRYQRAKLLSKVTFGLLAGAMLYSGMLWLSGIIAFTQVIATIIEFPS